MTDHVFLGWNRLPSHGYLTVAPIDVSVVSLLCAFVVLLVVVVGLLFILLKRRQTYRTLVQCGMPTVYWHPKFARYQIDHPKQLSATSITNILPRMQRLKGPYGGMYGTVYGVSTAVVHVAHPKPAMVLLGAGNASSQVQLTEKLPTSSSRSWGRLLNFGRAAACTTTGTMKTPAYNHFKNFCGEGVFTADGEDWRRKRAAVLHALLRSGQDTGTFRERIEQESHSSTSRMCRELDCQIAAASNSGVPFKTDIVPILQRTTIGLIYKYITHSELSSLEEDGDTTIEKPGEEGLVTKYLQSITRIRMIILAQSRSIWYVLPRWCYTYFSSLYREEERTMGPIRQISARACSSAKPDSPLHFLKGNPLYASDEQFSKNLLDEAITILFAGQDTSAATLSWTLHLLTLHPEVQAKLADEVCAVMKSGSDTVLTKKMISQMPYMDAVIKESMRLYPVAPFVVRKLSPGVSIPLPKSDSEKGGAGLSDELTLPASALVCVWIYSLHRHPVYWNKPDEFLPERWIGDGLAGSTKDLGIETPGAYIPFAAGPRNCVGQPLANVVLRTILANLIVKYTFRDDRVESIPIDPRSGCRESVSHLRKEMQAGFTVLPQGGLSLTVQLRNGACSDKQ